MSTKQPENFEQADARLTDLARGLPNDAQGFKLLMAQIIGEPDPAALLGVLTVIGAASKIQAANPIPGEGEGSSD